MPAGFNLRCSGVTISPVQGRRRRDREGGETGNAAELALHAVALEEDGAGQRLALDPVVPRRAALADAAKGYGPSLPAADAHGNRDGGALGVALAIVANGRSRQYVAHNAMPALVKLGDGGALADGRLQRRGGAAHDLGQLIVPLEHVNAQQAKAAVQLRKKDGVEGLGWVS